MEMGKRGFGSFASYWMVACLPGDIRTKFSGVVLSRLALNAEILFIFVMETHTHTHKHRGQFK